MTEQEIAEMEVRAADATAAPWFDHGPINRHRRDYGVTAGAPYDPSMGAKRRIAWVGNQSTLHNGLDEEVKANAAFIAHAREDVPALLSEVRRLQARITELEAQIIWNNMP